MQQAAPTAPDGLGGHRAHLAVELASSMMPVRPPKLGAQAPVAQRIERSPPEREVASSNLAGRVDSLSAGR